jgi:hypothetical protein
MELLLVVVGILLALWFVLAAAVTVLIAAMDSIDGPDATSLTITDVADLADQLPLQLPPRAAEGE